MKKLLFMFALMLSMSLTVFAKDTVKVNTLFVDAGGYGGFPAITSKIDSKMLQTNTHYGGVVQVQLNNVGSGIALDMIDEKTSLNILAWGECEYPLLTQKGKNILTTIASTGYC